MTLSAPGRIGLENGRSGNNFPTTTFRTAAPDAGIAFLGSQGDVWDAQKDMLMALLGAISVQILFGGVHDRQIQALAEPSTQGPSPS